MADLLAPPSVEATSSTALFAHLSLEDPMSAFPSSAAHSDRTSQPASTSQSDVPAPIYSLPSELLHMIFELAAPRFPSQWDHSAWPRERYTFLSAMSLVDRRWSEEARIMIWDQVVVVTDKQGKAILRSPALGRFKTMRARLVVPNWYTHHYLPREIKGGTAEKILERLVGVMHLELRGVKEGMSCRIFGFENLSDLKSLSIGPINFTDSCAVQHPPFALEELSIAWHQSNPSLPSTLFANPHLTKISFYIPMRYGDNGINIAYPVSTLPPIADQLKSLVVTTLDHQRVEDLLPILPACPNLTSLVIRSFSNPHTISVIQLLPETLTNLEINMSLRPINQVVDIISAVIASRFSKTLETFTLRKATLWDEKTFVDSPRVEEVMNKLRLKNPALEIVKDETRVHQNRRPNKRPFHDDWTVDRWNDDLSKEWSFEH